MTRDGAGFELDPADPRKLHDGGRPERELQSEAVTARVETERWKFRERIAGAEPAKLLIELGVDFKHLQSWLGEREVEEFEQVLPSSEEADPGHASYLPLKLGLRLFTNASTPSFLSSVAKRR